MDSFNTPDLRLARAREEVDYRYDLGYNELSDEVFFKLVKKHDLDIDPEVYEYLDKGLEFKKFKLDPNWNNREYFNNFNSIFDKEDFVTNGLIGHALYESDFNEARKKILKNILGKASEQELRANSHKQEILDVLETEIIPSLFTDYVAKHISDLKLNHRAEVAFLNTCRNIYYEHYDAFEQRLYLDMNLLYKLDREKSKIDTHHHSRQPIIVETNYEENYSASAERIF